MGTPSRLLIVVALMLAACASPTPEPTPTVGVSPTTVPSPTASPNPTSVPTAAATPEAGLTAPPPTACPLEELPGPADAPPWGSSEMDFSDLGPGKWRLCADPLFFETTAWCEWDKQRAHVIAVNGLPQREPVIAYDMWVSFALPAIELHVTDWTRGPGGLIANYTAPFELQAGTLNSDGLGGVLAFSVALQVDPETGPMIDVPTQYHGLMRWRCGDPPPA